MEMLRVSDTNHDGKLSVGEFVRHARKFPQIIKPAHNLQIQLRRRIIGAYFWERRSNALSRRYDLLAAGMFDSNWQEAGLGDWWGVYDQKWRHKNLDERDSLDPEEFLHCESDNESQIGGIHDNNSSGSGGIEMSKGARLSMVGEWKRRLSKTIGRGSVSPLSQRESQQEHRPSLLDVEGNDAQKLLEPARTSPALAMTDPPEAAGLFPTNNTITLPPLTVADPPLDAVLHSTNNTITSPVSTVAAQTSTAATPAEITLESPPGSSPHNGDGPQSD